LAAQMALGRPAPWLPEKFAERRISKDALAQTARGGRRYFGWAEAIAKPRFSFLTGRKADPVIGALLCLFCVSILTPLPGTNTVPGFAVALVSFGLMERDGLLTTGGLALGAAWVTSLVAVAVFGASILTGVF
ncbi:MAG: exopolysaccharide biosynthesis protein, partial [Pseudomonadota bacterium]